jgi:hypothetical protein
MNTLSTLFNTYHHYSTLNDPNYFFNSIDAGMNEPIFDLIIYHHGSLFSHRMAYVGGDSFAVSDLDADRFNILHLNIVLETYLDYPYNNYPNLFYKYDEKSNG